MGQPIAAAVIIADGRVLLIRRRLKEGQLSWQFPAGTIEPSETPAAAAVREAWEEVGLAVHATRNLGTRTHPHTGRRIHYFACDIARGIPHLASEREVAEFAWCSPDMLAERIPHPLHQPVREYLDAHLTNPGR